ncbi:MAG: hypothetical protein PQJ50_09820, partial [Spirochaetales bacterium]|nr:hypothetical protein [Spirochaetales bacterium]
TPDALYVSGWSASVTFGASWFYGSEFSQIRTYDGERLPNQVLDLVSEEEYRQLLYKAHMEFYGFPPEGDEPFPWDSGPWHEKRNVLYTMKRQVARPGITALVPCWSNSSRQFFSAVDLGQTAVPGQTADSGQTEDHSGAHFLPDFGSLKSEEPDLIDVIASPDGSTVYIITSDRISCYDSRSGSLLKTLRFNAMENAGTWNRVIMVESALGIYVDSWEQALEY